MAPVTKSTSEQGQISIFFSASLVVLVSIIAFVINIGLFVKAKINLQNATDAAAFAGAATQARQLTKIAYLNWEMRNIYKEWMYKYYVIGNLNTPGVENTSGSGPVSYRLRPFINVLKPSSDPEYETKDPYNVPSVCVHIEGSHTNICRNFSLPGLPEFGSSNLPGAEEASRALMDSLIGSKVMDCVERNKLNMFVAASWAYNVLTTNGDDTLAGRSVPIMANRQGAWPRAIELAMRIRNLEYAMNRPSQTQGVCSQPNSDSNINCSKSISDIIDENKLGNERIVKAFYSGFRNIGGSYESDEMKNTFTLTEIPPRLADLGNHESASYLLVPRSKIQNFKKPYADLKLMMANFAIFYSAMIPRASGEASAGCDVSKVAIPVPGYPLGFYKNPDIVTYYAVKGEASFVGMFNPFGESIKLTAYAAAKPFGGRIGPMLFYQENGKEFYGRKDSKKRRSVPYMSTLDVSNTPIRGRTLGDGEYDSGVPLPVNSSQSKFWIEDPTDPIGGLTMSGSGVQFGIPNLVYDYEQPFKTTGYSLLTAPLHKIKTSLGEGGDESVGLYSKFQLAKFKGNLGASVSAERLDYEIARVRAPTLYEAANYLIPTPSDPNFLSQLPDKLDSFGFVSGNPGETLTTDGQPAVLRYHNKIYAPLYKTNDQNDILFNQNDVVETIFDFMRNQQSGIDKYRDSLNQAAHAIYMMRNSINSSATGSISKYEDAAKGVSDINFNTDFRGQKVASCASIAGQFLHFYYGHSDLFEGTYVANSANCPKTLGELLKDYFSNTAQDPNYSATHYKFEYSWFPQNFPDVGKVFSAYMPGQFTGVSLDGKFDNPIPGSTITELMRRNFYSTKFITLDSLKANSPGYDENVTGLYIVSEGETSASSTSPPETKQKAFENYLEPQDDISSIRH